MVQTVQQQQAGQQELCRNLKADMEGLAVSQHEHGVRIETRMEELLQKQNARCTELEQRQLAVHTTIENLQQDVAAVKEVLHARIRATESGLEGLEGTQQRLTTELHAAKTTIMEEMMIELEARFATKDQFEILSKPEATQKLRPDALEFLPSLSSPTGSDEAPVPVERGATTSQLQKPPPFDGRPPWDAYKLQFEMLATVNGWSNAQKATYLAVSLRGPALTVLTNISADHRGDYDLLVAALNKRFGSAHQAELNRAKLRGRVRQREETLPELAEEVEHLARLAYPDAAAQMVEVLAKDQFIDALPDEEFRLRLRQGKPGTLQQALEQALELESLYQANKQRSKIVREVQLGSAPAAQVNKTQLEEGALETLQCILDAVQQCTSQSKGRQRSTNQKGRVSRATGQRPLVCWRCKKEGHIQRFCTEVLPSGTGGDDHTSQPSEGSQGCSSLQMHSGNDQ
jgi:hypothetical protein